MAETALYPTIVTTQLYEAKARTSTQLTADIDSLNTTIPVSSTSGFPSQGFISIGNETMFYNSYDATNFYVSRGYAGIAAAHNEGDDVKLVVAAATINRQNAEIVAIQDFIGKSGDTRTTTLYYKLHNLWAFTQGGSTVVSNLNAQYLGGSTEGQLSVLNASKLTSINGASISENDIVFSPNAFDLNNDNPASEVTITGTSIAPYVKKIEFGNTDQADLPPFLVPRTFNGQTITWSILYCSSTASSVFDLGIKGVAVGNGDTCINNYGPAVYFGNITCPAEAGICGYAEKAIAAASLGITGGKEIYLRILGGTTCSVQIINSALRWNKG
jgi:hypothetical protein